MYVWFLIGIKLNFKQENFSINESDKSVQLTLILSKAIEFHISVLLKCESIRNSASKFSFILMCMFSYIKGRSRQY